MLGKRLEECRKEMNMTKKEVAGLLKIDQSTYGKYELGKRKPDAEMLRELADIYETSVDYLLGRTDIKGPIKTFAARHADEDWTPEELEEIEAFKEFIRMRRKQRERDN